MDENATVAASQSPPRWTVNISDRTLTARYWNDDRILRVGAGSSLPYSPELACAVVRECFRKNAEQVSLALESMGGLHRDGLLQAQLRLFGRHVRRWNGGQDLQLVMMRDDEVGAQFVAV